MSRNSELAINNFGEADPSAFPEYPQFTATTAPGSLRLTSGNPLGPPTIEEVTPKRVWQGVIAPFETDNEARLSLRALASDRAIAVHGGTLRPDAQTRLVQAHREEPRLTETDVAFDILITEFEAPAHPWAFSLSPAIAQRQQRFHPHLRSDRLLQLPSRELHALCIYSAAEFTFDLGHPLIPQFLDQVAVFLAKHVIWLKTQRLLNRNGEIIHDGVDMCTMMSTINPDAIWRITPPIQTQWEGYWPGSSATNGPHHLSLDPEGECWCGKGKQYKDCCLPWERAKYLPMTARTKSCQAP